MKKTATILATLALSAVSVLAGPLPPAQPGPPPPPPPLVDRCAGPISYSTVELLYANTDSDFRGDDADGVRLNFEYQVASNFYVLLSGSYDEADLWDVFGVKAGVGGYIALTENFHIAADGGLVYADWDYDNIVVDANLLDGDSTGWYVRPHLRAKFGCFEVQGGATYVDIDNIEEWNFFVKAYFQIAHNWDITAGYNEGDNNNDNETWTVGARWRF